MLAISELHINKYVILTQIYCYKAAFTDIDIILDRSLLHDTLTRCKEEVFIFIKPFYRNHRINSFPLLDLNQVNNRSSSCRSAEFWDLVCFQTISFASIRKEHQIVVRVCHEKMLYKVIIFGIHTNYTTATTFLATVSSNWQTFNIPGMSNRNNNFFLWNQVFVQNTLFTHYNFSTAIIRIFFTNLIQLITNNLKNE
ncbi:hypothetical protein D3C81_1599960 [compost metagenome]